ncbi:HD domain-containing protein [Sphingobacterium multivorum]|uniref:HD domain-containing protein n=1 Tax=Sphingobacterium multivorum TaxID=28454 RepID=UPI0028A0C609|nr:hypothetical protein [Sphingobacterium multivorum]
MPQNNEIFDDFSSLAIWEHFTTTSGASIEDIAMVKGHIERAMPLLDRYSKTFPKYTLHNNRHQKNIVKIMGDLLGPDVNKLSALECGMLLLSAVYHDIGMVFSSGELDAIGTEPDFHQFLKKNTRAMLDYEENGRQPTEALIEWYCRWMHAKRVWIYLNNAPIDMPLRWGNTVIKQNLGFLCESHNMWVDEIIADYRHFHNDYLGQCDLMFCVILLRLADILDFDNSRTPKSVYEFLDLDNPKNKLDSISKIEWEKHLNSGGFQFRRNGEIVEAIFSATTPHPNIEVAIKEFIRTINSELTACNKLRKYCSEKWQKQPLPQEVDKYNLTSDNYQSGDYHFSLSQDKILTLLTGDGLYNDDFIFIRELLQNAIDTSRHREFHERQFNSSFNAEPIKVTFFTDTLGYQWIRIDDFGMGMNEEIIKNHLLKKGESYYNSDQFKLEKIQINKTLEKDFIPISRFGIGLLSCFMAGDRIEISTKHASPNSDSIRLGIEGRNGNYIFQSLGKHHDPIPMPAEFSGFEGYRYTAGTSIAVRITTNKESVGIDMKDLLEEYVLCSPITIMYDGNLVGGNHKEMVNEPWALNETIPMEDEFIERIEKTFYIKFKQGLNIVIENIDISKRSLNPNLMGQFLFITVDGDFEYLGIERGLNFKLEINDGTFEVTVFNVGKNKDEDEVRLEEKADASHLLTKFPLAKTFYPRKFYNNDYRKGLNGLLLSHNGIILNDSQQLFTLQNYGINLKYTPNISNRSSFLYSGILYFQDELLPDLSVSRNEIKGLPFSLIANLGFALEPLNKYIDNEVYHFYFFRNISGNNRIPKMNILRKTTSLQIEESGFYERNMKFLDEFIKVKVDDTYHTIAYLKTIDINQKRLQIKPYRNSFYNYLIRYIIEQNFEITATFDEEIAFDHYLLSSRKLPFPKGLLGFPSLTFVKFHNYKTKLSIGNKINIEHLFVQWYIKAAPLLNIEYFYYSRQLIYSIVTQQKMPGFIECKKILERLNTVLPEDLKPHHIFSLMESDFE